MGEVMQPSRVAIQGRHKDAVVLCIDDDELVLEVTRAILKKHGYLVLTATNGRHGLEIFRENAVDLVLLDYDMPGIKGNEVAVEMRAFNRQVPLVLHSGAADIPELTIQLTDAFISKGSETRVMLATIADLITKSRADAGRNGATYRACQSTPHVDPAK